VFPRIHTSASLLLAIPFAAASAAALPAPAGADGPGKVGVGIQDNAICAARPVLPGTTGRWGT
jgi:hypothetical protein